MSLIERALKKRFNADQFVGYITKIDDRYVIKGFHIGNAEQDEQGDFFEVMDFDSKNPNSRVDFDILDEFSGKTVYVSAYDSDTYRMDPNTKQTQNIFVTSCIPEINTSPINHPTVFTPITKDVAKRRD